MKDLHEIVNKDIKHIFESCLLNKLSLNFEKIKKEQKNFKKTLSKQKHSVSFIFCVNKEI